jgi:hypothetical protein
MRKELTYDNYDAMCQRYENAPFKCGSWWPSIIDIKTKLEPKLEQNLEFLIWIEETADKPKNEGELASQRYISALLRKTLVFVETKEELKQVRKEHEKNKGDDDSFDEDVFDMEDLVADEDDDDDDEE